MWSSSRLTRTRSMTCSTPMPPTGCAGWAARPIARRWGCRGSGSVRMSSVATMIATIEDQMDASTEPGANPEHLRMVEALLFAAAEPLDQKALSTSLPEGADVPGLLKAVQEIYEKR